MSFFFDDINEIFCFQVISVEHRHIPEGKESLISYMKDQNYTLIGEVKDVVGDPLDVIFAHHNALSMLDLET